MYLSVGCIVFFIFALFGGGMMLMAILLAGAEKEDKHPTKVIRISDDIEGSIVEPNVPGGKESYN